MIKSVIVLPSSNGSKKGSLAGNDTRGHGASGKQDVAHEKYDSRGAEKGHSHRRQSNTADNPHLMQLRSRSSATLKSSDKKKNECLIEDSNCTVTSIDLVTKINWPATAVKYTSVKPSLGFSCNPSFYQHNLTLSKAEEKRRTDLFIISDVLHEIIEVIDYGDRKSRRSKKRKHDRDHKPKKSKKKKSHKTKDGEKPANESATGSRHGVNLDDAGQLVAATKKSKKSKRHHKGKGSKKVSAENITQISEIPHPDSENKPTTSKEAGCSEKETMLSPSSLTHGENLKVEKQVKRMKRLKKKVMASTADGATGPSPIKRLKSAMSSKEEKHAVEENNQQKITIAFSQNSGKLSSTKSKWDTSSDEEGGSTRKGAISYRFSDASDTEKSTLSVKNESVTKAQKLQKPAPFGKMQPGGMLKTIEMHNPLPELKPSVPIAHPNPGPDGPSAKSPSKSRTHSRSKSRSRSRSASYSSDNSDRRSRRSRRHGRRRRRRSYSRSYSRSRSRSSSSRSRSRSYSRSYSRSTSRSRSRYRSYSRSSYTSYSSRSYSSRSRSRSPRYTRAVQPKYNNTRAYNLGKRKKFNKKKNQFKNQQNQQPHLNPNLQKHLETGRLKAEEAVMRLKKQKEEQKDLQKRAMASIAAAASSAGIPMPSMTTNSATPTSNSNSPHNSDTVGGVHTVPASSAQSYSESNDLVDSFQEASHRANALQFVPRPFQNKEFIGPVRPGMDSDIPLPAGTPKSRDIPPLMEDPQPMPAPDQSDNYRELQEQVYQHLHASNPSPDQPQTLPLAQYAPLQEAHTFFDPATGQHIQLTSFHTAQAVHQQQLMLAQAQQMQLQQQQQQQAPSPHTPDSGDQSLAKDAKPAPHEAVIESYAHQVFMSQQKALVSQSQPIFTNATTPSSMPQTGVPLQTQVVMAPAHPAHMQLQAAQMQLQAQAQAAAAAQAAQVAQIQQIQQLQQMQLAASMGIAPQALGLHQYFAQQQMMQQAQVAQGLGQQLVQLPNGQVVMANPAATQAMLFQRMSRPM